MIRWREAREADLPVLLALLADDALGALRETPADLAPYVAAFHAMQAEASNHLIVGQIASEIIATYQITYISGLSLRASRRAQIESVRVAAVWRDRGIGGLLMQDAEARAIAAGCSLLQLTTNQSRERAHRFYERLGYVQSHYGYKKALN